MPKHLIRLNRTLLALLLVLPLTALAQHSQPYLSESWSMVPKADRTEAFWEGLKEHMAVRAEHDVVDQRAVARIEGELHGLRDVLDPRREPA
mgnify:CR=1 FL=1